MAIQEENNTVLEKERISTPPPRLYQVILLNDDFTTMEFVIEVLTQFFGMNLERATQIMLKIHHEGFAVCGIYPRDLAETKTVQVSEFATQHGHPLQCRIKEN